MSSTTFDPYRQNITILMADGVTPVTVNIVEMDNYFHYNMVSCISLGTQIGASVIMFFVLTILTKASKRHTPVFILNALSLILSFLRALLLVLYFTSPWDETYRAFTDDFSTVPRSAYAVSIAGDVIPIIMTATVNMSLVIQAHAVCKHMAEKYRYTMSVISVLVFLSTLGFRFTQAITNSMAIMNATSYISQAMIREATLVTETVSIWYFSFIFTGKLVYTLHTRRRHGWRQWSAVRILTAMGGCTMIIPCESSLSPNLRV